MGQNCDLFTLVGSTRAVMDGLEGMDMGDIGRGGRERRGRGGE